MKVIVKIICAVVVLMQFGCTKEDLSVCIDDKTYFYFDFDITVEQPHFPFNRGQIYLFNDQGVYVSLLHFSSGAYIPFESKQTIELPSTLESGSYTAVSWAHLALNETENIAPYTITPSVFILNQTTYDEIEVSSSSSERNASHNATRSNTKDNTQNHTRNHTTGPTRNAYTSNIKFDYNSQKSGEVNLIFHQIDKAININLSVRDEDGELCTKANSEIKAVINCSDRMLDFGGRAIYDELRFDYLPYKTEIIELGNTLSKYRKMTLDKTNTNPLLQIRDEDNIIYSERLFTILEGTGHPTQESLDDVDHYDIDISINCIEDNGGTNITVSIWINGWKYVPINGDV